MKASYAPNLYLALIHYPVINKNGETIASAITNLDLHDIARLAKTFGVRRFYVVTPLADQKQLVERIVSHWTTGYGATYNPERRKALELICVKESLSDVRAHIHKSDGREARTVATSARTKPKNIGFETLRDLLRDEHPYLMLFGTAWGLSDDVVAAADYVLAPISGGTGYNHLSVRSAAAIILDRILGQEQM